PLNNFLHFCFMRRSIGATFARRFANVCSRRVVVGINQAANMTLLIEICHIRRKCLREVQGKLISVNALKFDAE
ncbi:hypothetical protein, partial [Paraburkholderia sp. BCC1884]|uniref:hypothetical protein n=1 Tax=Paraburkholderia sp. BCC1884 TaxID=2562668 RepID=UPI001C9272B3